MKYRADIDGLRAVAVLPVIAFHLGMKKIASGGYVGVDVFFVISGFLITRILCDEIRSGSYSLTGFYERRIKRIFPALYAMYGACVIGALALYFPSEVGNLGRSIVASVFFVSNVFFFSSSDYFDQRSEVNPLLHTWSLSVEEQFYIFLPILLFAFRRASDRSRNLMLLAVGIVSLVWAQRTVTANPSEAFYLLQFRAWELLVGGLIAVTNPPKLLSRPAVSEGLALFGIGAIGYSVVCFTNATVFPGVSALLPCLGAAAIMLAGRDRLTLVGRVLTLKPIVFIGKISYSAYLWHWPLIVFYRLQFGELERLDRLILWGLTLVAATVSWRFIEKPFRTPNSVPGDGRARATVLAGCAAMAVAAAVSLLAKPVSEAATKDVAQIERILAFADEDGRAAQRAGSCFLSNPGESFSVFDRQKCLGMDPRKPNVLLIGDSHAAHLWPGLKAVLSDRVNLLQANASGCKPVIGAEGEERCRQLMNYVFSEFLPKHRVDAVVFSARWSEEYVEQLERTVKAIGPHVGRIIISGPIVEYYESLPRLLAQSIASGGKDLSASRRNPQQAKIDEVMREHFQTAGVSYLSVYSELCTGGCVEWAEPGVPLQFDYGHLTTQGSLFLAKSIAPKILSAIDQRS